MLYFSTPRPGHQAFCLSPLTKLPVPLTTCILPEMEVTSLLWGRGGFNQLKICWVAPRWDCKFPSMTGVTYGGSDGKESACNGGDPGLIPGSGRSPREGNGNPHQCPCLENPMDRGAWRVAVHGVEKNWSRLND